jgi:hypothetical protein
MASSIPITLNFVSNMTFRTPSAKPAAFAEIAPAAAVFAFFPIPFSRDVKRSAPRRG